MDLKPLYAGTHKVLEIPEILLLIYGYSGERADLARWARVSRVWFSTFIPLLWEGYVEFQDILRLIPGAFCYRDDRSLPSSRHRIDVNPLPQERLPNEITSSMFKRLRIYAPFITHVDAKFFRLVSGPGEAERKRFIPKIMSYVTHQRVFPKLQALSISGVPISDHDLGGVNWLFLLISPSITDFRLGSISIFDEEYKPRHILTLELFSGLVLETCKMLEGLSLSITPKATLDLDVDGPIIPVGLPSLPSLNSLELANNFFTTSSLVWAMNHPGLESLELMTNSDESDLPLLDDLSGHVKSSSFGALRELNVIGVSFESFRNLWQSNALRNIVTLYLEFRCSVLPHQLEATLPLIAEHTPNVERLTFQVDFLSRTESQLLLLPLKSLPLLSISFAMFYQEQLVLGEPFTHWCSCWPQLIRLELSHLDIQYADLLKISIVLPNLLSLSMALPLAPPFADDIPSEPLTRSWPSHTLEFEALDGPGNSMNESVEVSEEDLKNLGL